MIGLILIRVLKGLEIGIKRMVVTLILSVTVFLMLVVVTSGKPTASRIVKIFSTEDEEVVNYTLDHNQCVGYGYSPSTFDYQNCMEKLQKHRKTVSLI